MDAKELKQSVDPVYALCDLIEGKTGLTEWMDIERGELKNVLKMEIINYLGYLAASDGVISWRECQFVDVLMDLSLTPERLNEHISENNIYSKEFEEKIPLASLQIAITKRITPCCPTYRRSNGKPRKMYTGLFRALSS